ncbi:MAG: outer membrane beta-barrel protein [bacterium]|nr:outer membrane beta-barrel protein [bacterium]
MNFSRIETANINAFVAALTLSLSNLSYADTSKLNFSFPQLVVTLGAGAAEIDNANAQIFPIINPVTDSFYNYSASKSNTLAVLHGFVGGEWKLNSTWATQAGLSLNLPQHISVKGNLLQGADVQSADLYNYQYTISSTQLLAQGKLLYLNSTRFYPYGEVGLGMSFNTAKNFRTSVSPVLTFTRQYANHTQHPLTYLLGAGIDMSVAQNVRIGVGYRFADLGKVGLGSASINNAQVNGSIGQNHFYTNEILAQLNLVK